MTIKVVYENDVLDEIEPSNLDELIALNRIKRFLRSDGWTDVATDPVRGRKHKFEGPERRRSEILRMQKAESPGVFPGGIVNDLNDLLTGILGNISLAKIAPPDRVNELLTAAENASQRAKELTGRLLPFPKWGGTVKTHADLRVPDRGTEEAQAETEGKGRVLVMDDEEVVRQVSGEMLRHMGYEVESAKDGAEVIDMYVRALESAKPFDVVILDLIIPGGMGGRETIKKLIEIDPGVCAIISSGHSNDPVISDFREYGFSGRLDKPYKIGELSEQIRKVMKGPAHK